MDYERAESQNSLLAPTTASVPLYSEVLQTLNPPDPTLNAHLHLSAQSEKGKAAVKPYGWSGDEFHAHASRFAYDEHGTIENLFR